MAWAAWRIDAVKAAATGGWRCPTAVEADVTGGWKCPTAVELAAVGGMSPRGKVEAASERAGRAGRIYA